MADAKEGWGRPAIAPKPHYFRDGVSLCKCWRYDGTLEPGLDADNDCKSCARLLKRSGGPIGVGLSIVSTPNAVTAVPLVETRQ